MTPVETARHYIDRKWAPIPVPFKEKNPGMRDWQKLHISAAEAEKYFNGRPQNIGVLTGSASNNLIDLDIDDPVALAVADRFLPPTAAVFGRPSKPRSHRLYYSDGTLKTVKFEFLGGVGEKAHMFIEVRGDGCQTVFPGSTHPSGELIEWHPGLNREPATVPLADLVRASGNVAAVALLLNHLPPAGEGKRHAFTLALAGALLRHAWDITAVVRFIDAVCSQETPDVRAKRIANVRSTAERMQAGIQVTGVPTVKDILGERIVRQLTAWLGLRSQAASVQVRPTAPVPQRPVAARATNMEGLLNDSSVTVPELAIEGFLPKQGLVLFGGRPKEGKSWFGVQTALAFTTGQALGGWLRVADPGRCHLWALEDGLAITKDKMTKILSGDRPHELRDIEVFDQLEKPILAGGDQIIRATLEEHPAELIILDSLFKLTGQTGKNQDISQRDYDVIDRVRKIALDHRCAVVIIMHTKKGARGGDPIENLLGTSGNTAAADVVCELKRNGMNGKLTVTGRMVPREDYEMVWHQADRWGWSIESAGGQADSGETAEEILAFLEAQGASKPNVVAAGIRKTFGAVWQGLLRLQSNGKVVRGKDKKWELAR